MTILALPYRGCCCRPQCVNDPHPLAREGARLIVAATRGRGRWPSDHGTVRGDPVLSERLGHPTRDTRWHVLRTAEELTRKCGLQIKTILDALDNT